MKTKQIIWILIALMIGILTGKFIFSGKNHQSVQEREEIQAETTHVEHWTCSMHPQIDLPQPGKCPICGMDLIPKTENNAQESDHLIKLTPRAIALAGVETYTIPGMNRQGDEKILEFPGEIQIIPENRVIQTSDFGGRIEKFLVQNPGELVKKGQIVAYIYSPELVTAQNELLEAYYIRNEQPELYKSVKKKLRNWRIPEKLIRQVEQTKKPIQSFPVYAAYTGYLDEIFTETGHYIQAGAPLFKLSKLNKVWAVMDVYEKDLPHLKTGQLIEIQTDALPGKIFRSKIDFISPVMDPVTRTIEVRATLNNNSLLLKPGMIITGKVKVNNKTGVGILIPKTAVLWTGKRSIVFVQPDKSIPEFELREIVLGNEHNGYYEILEGLNPGENVVVKGAFTIDAAAQLEGKKSMLTYDRNEKEKPAKPSMKCGGGMKCGAGM